MLVIFLFMRFFVVMFFFLHAFDFFFRKGVFTQYIHQTDDGHIRVHGCFQGILHPLVGFPADIDEDITVGNLHDVIGGRLVVMQVCPLV